MNELSFTQAVRPEPVELSHEERRKFFFYARWQAYQSMMMGVQAKQLRTGHLMVEKFQQEALHWLEVARDVFPLTRDGETCSIEDILNGKEPAEVDPRETGRSAR